MPKIKKDRSDIRDLIERGHEFRSFRPKARSESDHRSRATHGPSEVDLPDEVDDVDENMFPSAD